MSKDDGYTIALLVKIAGIELSTDLIEKAKTIAVEGWANNSKLTVLELLELWKAVPELTDFVDVVQRSVATNAYSGLFEDAEPIELDEGKLLLRDPAFVSVVARMRKTFDC